MSWGEFKPRLADAVRFPASLQDSALQHCTKDPRGYLSLYGKSVSLEGLQCDNQPAREGYIMTQDKLHGMTAVTNRGMQVSEVA